MDAVRVLFAKLVLSFATDFTHVLRWARVTVYGRLSPAEIAHPTSRFSNDDLLWIIDHHVLMDCRIAAVRKITNPDIVIRLGISHEDEFVREAAAGVISDQRILVRLACSDLSAKVRIAAATRITSIVHLQEITKSRFEDVRVIAEFQELKQRLELEIEHHLTRTAN